MSQKKDKLLRKAITKVAREKLSYEFELLEDIFKPRPKWFPRFIWELGLSIYVRKGEFEYDPWKEKNDE